MKTLGLVRVAQQLLKKSTSSSVALLQSRNSYIGQRNQHHGRQEHKQGENQEEEKGQRRMIAMTSAAVAAALAYGLSDNRLKVWADENVIAYENRLRQYSTPDQIFNYFATYMVSEKTKTGEGAERDDQGHQGTSRRVMMTPWDLFNAITPESPGHSQAMDGAAGAGNYITITPEELKTTDIRKSSIEDSVLNKMGKEGLLTYTDFCILLTILSTPRRYVNTAFMMLDINGDVLLDAQEFGYMSTKTSYNIGGFGTYRNTDADKTSQEEIPNENSGLLNYLFGRDRQKKVDLETFCQFQKELQDEIIELEFQEYDKGNTGRISEEALGIFLLKHVKIPPKIKQKMLNRVKKVWPSKKRGVSLPSFKNLYQTLAGGDDLERAVAYMDAGQGISYEEFRKISFWVSHEEMSDHVARVVFVLLDDDEDGLLSKDEVRQVLFGWRKARGFDKMAINVNIGPKNPKT